MRSEFLKGKSSSALDFVSCPFLIRVIRIGQRRGLFFQDEFALQ